MRATGGTACGKRDRLYRARARTAMRALPRATEPIAVDGQQCWRRRRGPFARRVERLERFVPMIIRVCVSLCKVEVWTVLRCIEGCLCFQVYFFYLEILCFRVFFSDKSVILFVFSYRMFLALLNVGYWLKLDWSLCQKLVFQLVF